MAISVSMLVRERRKYLRTIKPPLREVDSAIEATERELNRIIARKKALPEEKDLERLLTLLATVATKLSLVTKILAKGFVQ